MDSYSVAKSKKNVVAPEEIFESHGADAARLFVLSDSPPARDVQWTASGLEGAWRLVNRHVEASGDFAGLLIDVCGFLKGLETVEREESRGLALRALVRQTLKLEV